MKNGTIPAIASGAAAALCLLGCLAATAHAQSSYPNRPIRMVLPFAPGGGSDTLARMLGPRLSDRFGQPVVLENRPAAAGVVGADIVAKSIPDGYTLLGTTSTFVISGELHKSLPYDAFRDFAPITQAISSPFGLMVHPSVPAKSVKEFISYARANPGKLNYGSSGAGSSPHLASELFNTMAGVQIAHVPYKGIALANTALLGNEVQMVFSNLFSTLGHWKAGRMRILGHGAPRRLAVFPDIPTISEAGVPGFESVNWYGYSAPAKTPKPVMDRLYKEFAAVLHSPEISQTLTSQGNDVVASPPAEFAKQIEADRKRWGTLGRKLGITLD
jgi:tripartite-type tricarboxylate transporter receptor subunit TctC